MIKIVGRNIIRFIALILLQVFLFNNIHAGNVFHPYFYIIFILLLPFETPGVLLLSLSFFLGLSIDLFVGTVGMHAAACVLMGFARPGVLKVIAPRDGYETGTFPRVSYYGIGWFLKYTIILVFTHHFALFFIEVFEFEHFFLTLSRAVLSTLLTTAIIVISQFLVFRY